MNNPFQTKVVTADEDIAALESEWKALAEKSGSVLGSFEWLDTCRRWLNSERQPIVFVTRDKDGVRAIAPLSMERSGAVARLVALSQGSMEPAVFLYDDLEALRALCLAIIDFGMPLALARFHAGASELAALREVSRGHGRADYRENRGEGFSSSRVILAGLDWDTLMSGMPTSGRSYLRRKRRIAEREGSLHFEAHSPTEATVDALMDEMLRVEGSGWKGRARTSLASDRTQLRFYREYARAAARTGTLRIFFLKIGNANAATRMDVEFGNRLWEFKIGYDERFSRASPGLVLMDDTLAWACANRLDAYEFLGNYENWHSHWPSERYFFATLYYYPHKLSGLAALMQDLYRRVRRHLADNRNADSDISRPGELPQAPADRSESD